MGRRAPALALACRIAPRGARKRLFLLHGWASACDLLVEETGQGDAARQLRRCLIRAQTDRALAGERVAAGPYEGLRRLLSERPVPHGLIREHVDGCVLDAREWRPRSDADLIGYCRKAAGAAAAMAAVAAGQEPDAERLERIASLGIACELAEIARDMSEDDAKGRCWLPMEWLAEMDVPPGQHMKPAYRERMGVLACRLARLAHDHAAEGRKGLAGMPFRLRWAAMTAVCAYLRIASEVERRGAHSWDRRIRIGAGGRLAALWSGFRAALRT
jgi:15-cis-phytoene synthase